MGCSIGVFGRGRLGSLIASAIEADPTLTCAWMLGRDETPTEDVDVAVDVSHPDAVGAHVEWADRSATDLVIGATGWPAEALRDSGGSSGVLVAPNFSLSMGLMRRFAVVLGGYAAGLPGHVDLAVTETHHRGKVDAPSGSARLLADALAEGADVPSADIPTTSLRMGAVVGRHEVRFESGTEAIVLSHQAHTREVFAVGALAAARWIRGRRGVFTGDDWAADQLDDLFAAFAAGRPDSSTPASADHVARTDNPIPAPSTLQEQS